MRYMERQKISQKKLMNGKNSGAYFTFNTAIDNEINYQISISFVSIENAKENLKSERQFADFDFCKKKLKKYGIKIYQKL